MKYKKKHIDIMLTLLFLFCVGTGGAYLSAAADPFYSKLFQEGKTFFAEGKYREAIENFRIAEFGLFEEKEVLKELYLFYSLAYFKIGRVEEAREILKRIETELNIKDPTTISPPSSIKVDLKVMLTILLKNREKETKDTKKNNSWQKVYNFEVQFRSTLQNLENNKLDAAKSNIKKLESLDKKDGRINYCKGILKFKQGKYKACIKSLNKVKPLSLVNGSDRSLLDKFYYYLALSYHYLNNTEQRGVYIEGITDKTLKARLKKIIAETGTIE